jgi:uncharacterized protein YjaG (DUF416 family)
VEKNLKKDNKMNRKTITNIHDRLNKLSFQQKLVFVYFVFQRLFPNYIAFHKKEKWGNPQIWIDSSNLLKEFILNPSNTISKDRIEELKKVTPDTDEFSGFSASLALDACAALLEGFGFIEDKDSKRIVNISTSSLDLTQMYIEFRDKTDNGDYTYDDPLFIEEIDFQHSILNLIENQQQIDETFLTKTEIEKSKLGSLLTGIRLDELTYKVEKEAILPEFQIDDEIREWIKANNINLNVLISELVKNFYRTMKNIQKNAAV